MTDEAITWVLARDTTGAWEVRLVAAGGPRGAALDFPDVLANPIARVVWVVPWRFPARPLAGKKQCPPPRVEENKGETLGWLGFGADERLRRAGVIDWAKCLVNAVLRYRGERNVVTTNLVHSSGLFRARV
jgi:hypothetical protein